MEGKIEEGIVYVLYINIHFNLNNGLYFLIKVKFHVVLTLTVQLHLTINFIYLWVFVLFAKDKNNKAIAMILIKNSGNFYK